MRISISTGMCVIKEKGSYLNFNFIYWMNIIFIIDLMPFSQRQKANVVYYIVEYAELFYISTCSRAEVVLFLCRSYMIPVLIETFISWMKTFQINVREVPTVMYSVRRTDRKKFVCSSYVLHNTFHGVMYEPFYI